jgi:Protein of unknown function (DUF3800)
VLHAYIDEAGDRAITLKSSDYFVLSAVVIDDQQMPTATALLAQMRSDLGRRPGDTLSWKNIKGHAQRLQAADLLGASPLTISSVVVCKRHLARSPVNESQAYLYPVRYLLSRLSWLARDQSTTVDYTLAMIRRFPTQHLGDYEAILRAMPNCEIEWAHVAGPGRIDQPSRVENLQLGDLAASAIAPAFEPDKYGRIEDRYCRLLAPRFYRRGRMANRLTSYGLKLHPSDPACAAAHGWIRSL